MGTLERFQSTLPRGERQSSQVSDEGLFSVSIHAPARGATDLGHNLNPNPRMFQSTLPRGERHTATLACYIIKMFQSTLPRGERPKRSNTPSD